MVDWYVDPALQRFIDQWQALHPGAVVGTIGDPNHRPPSGHLPEADGSVDAGDAMPGPTVSQDDLDELAETLRLNRDPRILYVIRRDRIFSGATGTVPFEWRPYGGDYHHHLHLNVGDAHEGQPVTDWDLTPPEGDDMGTPAEIAAEVWKSPAREYADEDSDGTRETRTTKDILYAAHAAAVRAEDYAREALNVANGTAAAVEEILSRLPAPPPPPGP